ncbi:ornithine cyclodeaminase family protein (plasmid) [Deinococcus taeanensis]|uniref:ornithine cyclodeaminase family protein n=1 Tax=Deinococcus taeanensis TaxID=2737050 RepID=UPI001CDBFF78|nr:ornithine cyclodeaminase family protein [Deinococcus taeanensis]UBV45327.1 ornithine cyclodeaminase family protein [Deinococcus taeanensis]
MAHAPLTLTVLDDATIRGLLRWPDVIDLIDATFAADGRGAATVLPVIGHSLNGGRYSIKTSHLRLGEGEGALEVFGLKMGSYFPGNAARALPTHSAAMLLGDPHTGQPAALLAANAITEYRTAAAGAVAARHLARADAGVVALLGTGAQARAQLEALARVRPVREVRVWSRSPGQAERFVQTVALPGVTLRAARDAHAACDGADLVVTVTPAEAPIVWRDWIAPGTHINAMGSDAPGKQELDPALVAAATVVVDRRTQSVSIGELQRVTALGLMQPGDVHAELGEVCAGIRPGRQGAEQITVFDSTGVSFQDTALAGLVLRLARKGRALQTITL